MKRIRSLIHLLNMSENFDLLWSRLIRPVVLGNPQIDTGIKEGVKRLESRTYIIGREGHIYINDPTVSKQHAEIQVVNGEVYLRDLESTNGTFLIKNNRLVPFHEGYVQLHQLIVLGNRQYTVRSLLEIAGAFSAQFNG